MTDDVAEALQYRKAEIAVCHVVCLLSKYCLQNSAKLIFTFFSTHSQSHIYHKQSAVTFPVTKLNFLCCTV